MYFPEHASQHEQVRYGQQPRYNRSTTVNTDYGNTSESAVIAAIAEMFVQFVDL